MDIPLHKIGYYPHRDVFGVVHHAGWTGDRWVYQCDDNFVDRIHSIYDAAGEPYTCFFCIVRLIRIAQFEEAAGLTRRIP